MKDERIITVAKMTQRGQIVIPEDIRIAMNIEEGAHFVCMADKGGPFIMLAPFEPKEIAAHALKGKG